MARAWHEIRLLYSFKELKHFFYGIELEMNSIIMAKAPKNIVITVEMNTILLVTIKRNKQLCLNN